MLVLPLPPHTLFLKFLTWNIPICWNCLGKKEVYLNKMSNWLPKTFEFLKLYTELYGIKCFMMNCDTTVYEGHIQTYWINSYRNRELYLLKKSAITLCTSILMLDAYN